MKKISRRCKNKVISNYLLTLLRLYEALDEKAKTPYFQKLIAQLSSDSEALLIALKLSRSTGSLTDADKKRDRCVSAVKTLLQAALLSPKAEEEAAAAKLKEILDKYKGVTAESYREATSDIESLLLQLKSEENAALVASVSNLDSYVKALSEAHENFKVLSDSSTSASQMKGESASKIKERVISLINDKVVPFMCVSADESPELYGDFDRMMDAEADKINSVKPKQQEKTEAKAEK